MTDTRADADLGIDEAVRLTTQPVVRPPVRNPLRHGWRQLTSMRTALLLLFLLALASVPGGFLPQRQINPLRVDQYVREHTTLGPLMERLSLFDVFSSAWFSAIYLLLFVSLIGCLIPRTRLHLKALVSRPPKVPRSLAKLPVSESFTTSRSPQEELDRAAKALRGWRLERRGDELSAERGYLRETGNLVFHLSLVLLLVGIAIGAFKGFKGTVLVVEGRGFSNTIALYDDVVPGRRFDAGSLVPFSVMLEEFRATYDDEGKALTFDADVRWSKDGGPETAYDVRVNHPLKVDGANTYLIGHGYAPHLVFRDATGEVVDDIALPCLPQDPQFLSTCVLKEPSVEGKQVGFRGVFTPTTVTDEGGRVGSTHPDLKNPALTLVAFEGSLGLDSGEPQSVYTLDTSAMTPVDGGQARALLPGQTWTLPSGASLTYVDTREWATFQVTQDPGKLLALLASIGMVAGLMLSLFIRRRRLWVRAGTDEAGATSVTVGGLSRTDPDRFAAEFADVVARMKE